MNDFRQGRQTPPPGEMATGAESVTAAIAGSTIQFTGGSSGVHERLAALLDPFLVPAEKQLAAGTVDIAVQLEAAPDLGGWRVYINHDFLTMAYDSTYLLPYLEWLAISHAIARSSRTVAFHAAAVARERQAVILIAASGAGKTTITAGLAARGWQPLADDLTVVDVETRAIHPFHRAFHADTFTRALIGKSLYFETPDPALPDYIRPQAWAGGDCAPASVAVIRRDPESPSSIQPITRAQAAGALFTSAIQSALPRSRVARLSADIATQITSSWELNNSDLTETLDLLEGQLLGSS
ncbi:MAG TPA: hypothetical protein VF808_09300 [Ktedonobacterales bacterium]